MTANELIDEYVATFPGNKLTKALEGLKHPGVSENAKWRRIGNFQAIAAMQSPEWYLMQDQRLSELNL